MRDLRDSALKSRGGDAEQRRAGATQHNEYGQPNSKRPRGGADGPAGLLGPPGRETNRQMTGDQK